MTYTEGSVRYEIGKAPWQPDLYLCRVERDTARDDVFIIGPVWTIKAQSFAEALENYKKVLCGEPDWKEYCNPGKPREESGCCHVAAGPMSNPTDHFNLWMYCKKCGAWIEAFRKFKEGN